MTPCRIRRGFVSRYTVGMKRAVVAAFAIAVVVPSASAAAPRLVIANSSPLVVSGSHFKAGERVTVTFGQSTRRVRTTRLGRFRASFAGVAVDRCSGLRIAAVGARGDRALLVQSRVKCAPASSD
jgi:hypothetical protein